MKKKNLFSRMLLLLALIVGSSSAWADDTYTIGWGTASGTAGTYTNFTAVTGSVTNVLSFSTDKNSSSNAPAYNANSSELRLYYASSGDGGSITLTPVEGVTITGFVMTTSTAPSVKYSVDNGTATSVSASNNTYTVTGISAASSLKIQNANTTNTQLRIKTIQITYTTSGSVTPTCATPTFSPTSGSVTSGTEVHISTDTQGATIYYTMGTNPSDPTTSSNVYDDDDPIIITEATTIKAIAVKADYNNSEVGTAEYTIKTAVPGYTIDFESDLDCYIDWEFDNIGIHTSGLTSAHSGSAWGSNVNSGDNGTATASITTKEAISNPGTFTCYISKESTNSSASKWSIQVSSDGSSWDSVEELESMTQNTWTEFTADLSSYSNVYVRLYYSGSTAKRAVDDISLTMSDPTALVAPVINVPETFVGSTTATITCATEGATILYSYDNSTWTEYTEALTITETKTIYAKATKGEEVSEVVSKTTTKVMPTPTVTIDHSGITNTDVYVGTNAGSLSASVTYNNAAVEGATITWSGNNDAVATINASTGAVTLVAAGSVTFTATFAGNADYNESTATYDMTVTNNDPNAPGTHNNPYTVAQAIAATPSSGTTDNVYIQGIVSSFQNTSIVGDGNNYRYYISDDGTTTTQLLVYKGKGLNQATFTNANDLLVGDEIVICGKLTTYQDAPEVASGNYLVSWNRPSDTNPSITVAPATIEVATEGANGEIAITFNNLEITADDDFGIQYYDEDEEEIDEPNWIATEISKDGDDYQVSYVVDANNGAARTAYFKVFAQGTDDFVYSNLITITQAKYVAPTVPGVWVETDLADLTENDIFVIVGNNGSDYAMSNDNGTTVAPSAEAVSVENGKITSAVPANIQWNISVDADGYTFYPNGSTSTWLYCINNNNGVRVGTNTSKTFTIDDDGYLFHNGTSRFVGIYNSQDWRCYNSHTGNNNNIANQTFKFYKKVVSVTISSAKYATYSSANALDFEGTGVTAYIVTAKNDANTSVTMTPVTKVPAETGLVLYADVDENTSFNIPVAASAEDLTQTNYLHAHLTAGEPDVDGDYYILALGSDNKPGFFKSSGGSLAANRAYLVLPESNGAPSFSFDFGGGTTGIENLTPALIQGEGVYYDLSGRRVAEPTKGIYILNGKKVVVK